MKLSSAVLGIAAIGGVALATAPAMAAMPNGLPHASDIAGGPSANVDQVRMVCNAWGRCWWRPNYRAYGAYGYYGGPRRYYAPRYYGGYGHRHWRRW